MAPTLDSITRSVLMQRGYTLHWYVQFLKYASDCLRELKFDTLRTTKPKLVDVGPTGILRLPHDCLKWMRVAVPKGQHLDELIEQDINPLPNLDAQGLIIDYPEDSICEYNGYGWFGWNSALFGWHGGTAKGFKDLQNGYLQLTQDIKAKKVLVEYIADGSDPDSATKVEPYAQACIEAYMTWKFEKTPAAKFEFDTRRKELKGRVADWSVKSVKNIWERHEGTVRG